MFTKDIEQRLGEVFNDFIEFYIPIKYQKQFRENAFIAGGCIYDLANDREPKDYDFFVSNRKLVNKLANAFRNGTAIRAYSNNAITFGDGEYQIVTKYIGSPEDVVGQFDFKHNMFYFYHGKVVGLVEQSYLKSKRLVFNAERARDIAGILLRIPKFISRGMTITNSELASIILKLCNNFDSNELRILDEKAHTTAKIILII